MKKTIIITSIVASSLMILDGFNIVDSLTLFFLAGVIPGTDIRISAVDMMSATATAITIIVLRLTVWARVRPFFFDPPHASTTRKSTSRRAA